MKRQEKAARISALLERLYPNPPVPLDYRDPYTLLVAVLLSAQCTDRRVNTVTPGLFELADHPEEMAEVAYEDVLDVVRPCGLGPSKARNIIALSKLLAENHGSTVPQSLEALEALPGVGHKTASVVMAQAFGVPTFPVDTHIHRLAGRWGLSRSNNVVGTERDLKKVFPREIWNDLHIQIIYFGREHCPSRGHDLTQCPICGWAATKKRVVQEMGAKGLKALQDLKESKVPRVRPPPITQPLS